MYTRATAFSVTSRASRYSAMHGATILRLQEQISSGLKLTKPSDNPLAFRQASALQGQLQSLRSSVDVIADATTKLNISVSNLTEVADVLATAQRLAQQGIQALDQSEKTAIAIEAEQLLTRLQQIGNSQYADQYLYGGTKSNQQPYEFGNPAVKGGTLQSIYRGTSRAGESVISPGVSVPTLFAGNQLFGDNQRSATVVYGKTGAAAGAGTDTMIGRATLQVRHVSTVYAGGSGIQASATSPGNDNILGALGTHHVTINDTSGNGTAGTISLNGGEPINWDSAMTDLVVVSDQGEEVRVDMSAITAGFSGTVDITANGSLSVDNGATTEPIDFSGSQVVVDSTSGRYTHLDSSQINRTGDDFLEFPGTSDAFQVVYELIQDLRGTREMTTGDFADAMGRRLKELNHLGSQVLETMGVQSASLAGMENLSIRNDKLQYEVEAQLSNLQSTDIAEAVLRLQNAQILQQFTYTVTSQIMSQSFVNFLR